MVYQKDTGIKGEGMICYKDMTFCSYYKECEGIDCIRALTPQVKKDAKRIGFPICQFLEKPDCNFLKEKV